MIVSAAALSLAAPLVSAAALPVTPTAPGQQFLLTFSGEDLAGAAAQVVAAGGRVLQAFPIGSAMLVELPGQAALPAGAVVVPDQPMTFNAVRGVTSSDPVNTYRDTINDQRKLDGDGVTVAVVDTGVADTGELNVDHVNVSNSPQGDGLGHGTFLAGLVAGNGASSGGAYQGVAPGAKILDVKVADADGSTSMTQVLAGLQAVADRQATDPSVKVVSLALSTGSPLPPWLDPLTRALRKLWANGATVVVAAGNDGEGTVTAPASDPTLLAVGATDENKTANRSDDVVADFSAYDKLFGVIRPDVVAPGVSLVSLRAPGSIADNENAGSRIQETYFKGTGTSMSEAIVAGAAAALSAKRPNLTPNDVKRLIVGTAYDSKALRKKNGAGAGSVDLGTAATTAVSDTPRLAQLAESSAYGPAEADAAAWDAFATAWANGDLKAVAAAWVKLSPQTRKWAANAWALAVLTSALDEGDPDWAARKWAARKWATQNWSARKWAEDAWVARKWATVDWSARKWATVDWSARKWAGEDWLSFAWATRTEVDEVVEQWTADDFEARKWAARKWANVEWTARKWAADAWDARKWADYSWDARKWAADEWTARKWADFSYDARKWATEDWSARKWAVSGWNL